MATYEFTCDTAECNQHNIDLNFPMAADESTKTAICPTCAAPLRKLISGGTGVIFKGEGWTPKFSKGSPPPYDPEKDMESVDRQRKETGMEESDWRPKKAVHPVRSAGLDIPAPSPKKASA